MRKIHTYISKEPMLQVNAFIIESAESLVIVDTTLTMSDSIALKKKADDLQKPLAGIILTHAHPDHVAGTTNIIQNRNLPIYSTKSVKALMEKTEQSKHQQWSSMFGNEWIPKWEYPNKTVVNNEKVNIGDLIFRVIDIGSGGDCDANSLWLLEDENPASFLGDFIYNNNHTYMADGNILRWLINLERYSELLKDYNEFYIGHGETCNYSSLEKQKEYILTYCSNLLKVTEGNENIPEDKRKKFEQIMLDKYPGYGCQFMVELSLNRVASELKDINL